MKAWFIPSWNGDLRLTPHDGNPQQTVMLIEKPTVREQQIVNQIGEQCVQLGYLKRWDTLVPRTGWFAQKKWRFVIDAPMDKLGPVAASIMRPGPAVLTAVRFVDGQCLVTSEAADELVEAVTSPYRVPAALPPPPVPAALPPPDPDPTPIPGAVAVTVARPTPCCPDCMLGAIRPATEALLSFLTPEQHECWAKHRYLLVDGGLSGHRYVLAHRHTPLARQIRRICYDLTDKLVVHFHDWSVPPEEEVLASMLILQHREHWLRNEATIFGPTLRYKNPFGDVRDGVWDSEFTARIGQFVLDPAHQRALA